MPSEAIRRAPFAGRGFLFMTIRELFERIRLSLCGQYTPEEARFLAKILVSERTGQKYPWAGEACDRTVEMLLKGDVPRLLAGEPYQYVLGNAPFLDFFVEVNPEVLIPRPETEELAQRATVTWREVGGRALDVGTGSGCIAIALARAGAEVYALEPSRGALAVARANAARLGVSEKIRFIAARIEEAENLPEFGLVVSNPPYVPPDYPLPACVKDFEPHTALFTPPGDPLYYYRQIVEKTRAHRLWFEVHERFAAAVADYLKTKGRRAVSVERDFRGNARFVGA
jgi:release factor glutamine methyltransferase